MNAVSIRIKTVNSGIWLLFALATTILTIFIGVLYWNLGATQEIARRVQLQEVISKELDGLLEDLLNAETGQRGYLLTTDEKYLVPFQNGIKQVHSRFQKLREMAEYEEGLERLDKLEFLAAAKESELTQTLALARVGKRDEAMSIVRNDSGKQLMDEFREVIQSGVADQIRILAYRRLAFASKLNTLFVVLVVGGIGCFLVLLLTTVRTVRRLGSPIADLVTGINAIAEGDLTHKVKVFTDDEIGNIAIAVNEMNARISVANQARDSAQVELERSNADLDRFAYIASHDLKAPLRGIRNLAEWITEDIKTTATDETRENLRLLHNRVDRLGGLLDSLLAYSRVGRKIGHAENIDVGKLVGAILVYLAPAPGFTVAYSGEAQILTTPRAPLELVLRNLISNAITHHDQKHGRVTISAQKSGNDIEFRVEDDGPGIAPEYHAKIFEMFQTLKPRDQVEGGGMGLAIVRKTVESFGGSIRVQSSPPARGAVFIFFWPAVHVQNSDSK